MSVLEKGREITIKRISRGWDKSVLAKKAGINHSLVVRAEQGGSVRPATAKALADALDVSVFDIFELRESKLVSREVIA